MKYHAEAVARRYRPRRVSEYAPWFQRTESRASRSPSARYRSARALANLPRTKRISVFFIVVSPAHGNESVWRVEAAGEKHRAEAAVIRHRPYPHGFVQGGAHQASSVATRDG